MLGKAIVFVNEKGGVGKTALAIQTAWELAAKNKKVCLIDNDPSGDATTSLFGDDLPEDITNVNLAEGIANTQNLYIADADFHPYAFNKNFDVFGADDRLRSLPQADLEPAFLFSESVEALLEYYDYVIIDCPPSFSMEFTAGIIASKFGGIVIPAFLEELAYKATSKVIERVKRIKRQTNGQQKIAGIILNNVRNPMPKSQQGYEQLFREDFANLVFKQKMFQSVKVPEAIALQDKLSTVAGKSAKVSKDLAVVVKEIIKRINQ